MDKLKFTFQSKPTMDGKSNYIAITSITTQDLKIFVIPEEYQAASFHKHIQDSKAFVTIKNTLKKRHQSRSIWIKVSENILKTYVDDEGNMIFEDQFLEEMTEEQWKMVNKKETEDPITKILEKLVNKHQKTENHSIKNLADRFVIDKFDEKNMSAYYWLEVFEKECSRFEVTKNEEKIEILRLFLQKSSMDWYSSMMIRLSLQSEWSEWKSHFLQTYGNRGWSASKYALSFKYQIGSLLEYAIKKEKLILQVRKTIDEGTLIDIIAAGLPDFVTDRINKEEIVYTKDLFNELGKLEHLLTKKKYIKKKEYSNDRKMFKEKCSICEKLNKGERYHPESSCWFASKINSEKEKKQIKVINNSELECELKYEDQKN